MSTDPNQSSDQPGDINYDALRDAREAIEDVDITELEKLAEAIESSGEPDWDENPAVQTIDEGIRELEAMQSNLKVELRDPAADPEFQARLTDLEERSRVAGQARKQRVSEKKKQMKSDQDSAQGLALGLSIAYTIMGLPVAGFIIGWFIDSQTQSVLGKGLGVMIGAIAGIAMALLMIQRQNSK